METTDADAERPVGRRTSVQASLTPGTSAASAYRALAGPTTTTEGQAPPSADSSTGCPRHRAPPLEPPRTRAQPLEPPSTAAAAEAAVSWRWLRESVPPPPPEAATALDPASTGVVYDVSPPVSATPRPRPCHISSALGHAHHNDCQQTETELQNIMHCATRRTRIPDLNDLLRTDEMGSAATLTPLHEHQASCYPPSRFHLHLHLLLHLHPHDHLHGHFHLHEHHRSLQVSLFDSPEDTPARATNSKTNDEMKHNIF